MAPRACKPGSLQCSLRSRLSVSVWQLLPKGFVFDPYCSPEFLSGQVPYLISGSPQWEGEHDHPIKDSASFEKHWCDSPGSLLSSSPLFQWLGQFLPSPDGLSYKRCCSNYSFFFSEQFPNCRVVLIQKCNCLVKMSSCSSAIAQEPSWGRREENRSRSLWRRRLLPRRWAVATRTCGITPTANSRGVTLQLGLGFLPALSSLSAAIM